MANYDDTNGVWRTIGGRRVFIREGKSLSEAMKESGKFKRSKKAESKENIEKKNSEKQIEKEFPDNLSDAVKEQARLLNTRGYDDIDDVIDDFAEEQGIGRTEAKYALLKDEFKQRQGAYMDARADGSYSDAELNHMESMAKDSYFKLQEAQEQLDGFNKDNRKVPDAYKDSMITSRNDDEVIKDLNQRKEQLSNRKNRYTPEEYKEQEDGLNAGIKYAEKQKTGATYKASDLEEGKPYEIDMGNGIKKTAIYLGKDTDGNSAFYDGEGVNGTFAFSDNFINEKVKVSDNKDDEKFIDLHSQLRHRDANREHKTKINTAMDVPGRISENKDLAEQIIADDEWNDIQAHYYGGTNAEIVNERTGKRVKITPYDNKETLSKKIEESYKAEKPKRATDEDINHLFNKTPHKTAEEKRALKKNEWIQEEGGVHTKVDNDGTTNYIQGVRKGDGSHEYTRTDYDKSGKEIRSNTYKTLEEAKASKVNESNVRKLFDKDKEYKFDNNAKNEPEWKEKNKAILEKGYKEETGTEPYKNGKEKTSFEDYQTWRYGKEVDKQNKTEPKTFFEGKRDIEAEARQIYAEDGIRATSDRNLEYFSKKYDIPKDQAKAFIEETAKRFDEENEKKNRSNDWVRDAFNKYKKDHPKTKLTIQDFMKNQKK